MQEISKQVRFLNLLVAMFIDELLKNVGEGGGCSVAQCIEQFFCDNERRHLASYQQNEAIRME